MRFLLLLEYNGSIGNWFWKTVRDRQVCLLSPTLFNIFLERIMTDALEDHEGTVSTGSRAIISPFCWWLSRRGRRTTEISCETRQSLYSLRRGDQYREDKSMTNNTSGINKESKNEQKLETVTHFKYVGSVVFKPLILSRIVQTKAALTRLKPVQDTTDAFSCHIRLSVCMWITDLHSRAAKGNTSHGNEVLPQATTHLIQRLCYQ